MLEADEDELEEDIVLVFLDKDASEAMEGHANSRVPRPMSRVRYIL
jgi:hypothetical protein